MLVVAVTDTLCSCAACCILVVQWY